MSSQCSSILPSFTAWHCRIRCESGSRGKTRQSKPPKKDGKLTVGFGGRGKRKEPMWRCVKGCGACCELDKGPSFPSPDEILDNPSDIQLYRSMTGADGWCVNFDKSTRTCSIYDDRPYFCRVEPSVFQTLYGIEEKKFNKEACSCCKDTIKAIYGATSEELDRFNRAIRNADST